MINRFMEAGICLVLTCFSFNVFSQKAIQIPLEKGNLSAVNREVEVLSDQYKGSIVKVNAREKSGIIWINDLIFESGSIEFDLKGKDVLQESFVGIAFHGKDDTTYESVYFRPFNFNAKDSVRKVHAVQYMALPAYDWPYLRKTFNGKYEAPTGSFIDSNDWFHVKVVVSKKLISIFMNDKPVLEIPPLEKPIKGKVGFWVGNGSDGFFSNLVVKGGQWTKN